MPSKIKILYMSLIAIGLAIMLPIIGYGIISFVMTAFEHVNGLAILAILGLLLTWLGFVIWAETDGTA